MKCHIAILIIILCSSFCVKAQDPLDGTKDIDSLLAIEERPVILFFSADWCKFCAHMSSSFDDIKDSTMLLEKDFYLVKVDEKETNAIKLYGKQHEYLPRGIDVGEHELTKQYAMKDGELAYPTTVILWKEEKVFSVNSVMSTERIYRVLNEVKSITSN